MKHGRLIDADALKREYQEQYKLFTWDDGEREKATLARVIQMLHAQPTIEERKWIPCSERLPEKYGMYLVTMTEKAKAEDLGFDVDDIQVSKMRYNSNGWQLPRHIPAWINDVITDEVIAWQPLPEPYAERRTDERT